MEALRYYGFRTEFWFAEFIVQVKGFKRLSEKDTSYCILTLNGIIPVLIRADKVIW